MKKSLLFIFTSLLALSLLYAGSFMGGNFGIGTTTPEALLTVNNGAVLAKGSTGSTPISGGGRRLMWVPAKSAIRAGEVTGTEWDDANIGGRSAAFGYNNTAAGTNAFAAGSSATASGLSSAAIGYGPTATGVGAVALGRLATASGDYSYAMGRNASATGNDSVAMGYNTLNNTDNRITMRFLGGYYFYSNVNPGNLGVLLAPNSTSWGTLSDKNRKENFRKVDTEKMLQKLDLFTFTTWNYKGQKKSHRHYGPMAQDFYKAFGKDALGSIGQKKYIESYEFSAINFNLIAALRNRTSQNKKNIEELKEQLQKTTLENERLRHELSSLKNDVMNIKQQLAKGKSL